VHRRTVRIRKPLFFPLNYGDELIFESRIADSEFQSKNANDHPLLMGALVRRPVPQETPSDCLNYRALTTSWRSLITASDIGTILSTHFSTPVCRARAYV
jgi:hypothetical protein